MGEESAEMPSLLSTIVECVFTRIAFTALFQGNSRGTSPLRYFHLVYKESALKILSSHMHKHNSCTSSDVVFIISYAINSCRWLVKILIQYLGLSGNLRATVRSACPSPKSDF